MTNAANGMTGNQGEQQLSDHMYRLQSAELRLSTREHSSDGVVPVCGRGG
jgi:hypothetical protein